MLKSIMKKKKMRSKAKMEKEMVNLRRKRRGGFVGKRGRFW